MCLSLMRRAGRGTTHGYLGLHPCFKDIDMGYVLFKLGGHGATERADKATLRFQIGYGSNKKTRHMMPSGHKAFLVHNVNDVELLLMHNMTFAAEYVFSDRELEYNLTVKQDWPCCVVTEANRDNCTGEAAGCQGYKCKGENNYRGLRWSRTEGRRVGLQRVYLRILPALRASSLL